MDCVCEFTDLPIGKLDTYLSADKTTPFAPSQLFDSSKETKFVDESLRSSSFRTFEKKEIFDIFEETIMKVC